MDDAPVVLAGDGIGVAFAQEADIIRVHQLIDRRGVCPELAVIKLDRALILLTAMHKLDLLVALDRCGDARCSHRQGNEHERRKEEHKKQQESALGIRAHGNW